MTDLALYWLGKTYVKVGRTQDAIQSFRTLKTKYPKSAMAPLAGEQLARLEKEQVAALPPAKEPRAERPPEGLAPPTRPATERKVEPEKPAPPPVVAKKEPPPAVAPPAPKPAPVPEKKEPIAKAPSSGPKAARCRQAAGRGEAGCRCQEGRASEAFSREDSEAPGQADDQA